MPMHFTMTKNALDFITDEERKRGKEAVVEIAETTYRS